MTEQQRHTVVRAFPGFDVRRYPDRVLVQVHMDGDLAHAARHGARLLQRYLAGYTRSAGTSEPAAPVLLERTGESGYLVGVALPNSEMPPAPADDAMRVGVRLREVPGHEAAVLRFTGGLSIKSFTGRGRDLLLKLRAGGLEPVGAVYYARYDPSWKPGFLAQNEALVWVTSA